MKKKKEKVLIKSLDKMHKYKTMISYCLQCKKIQKAQLQEFQKLVIIKQCYYQNVLYVVVKNQDLSKNKKQMDH